MQAFPIIDTFCQECRRINAALLAMIAGRFPVFLVPNPILPISQLQDYYSVRIFWNEKGWYLRSQGTMLMDNRNDRWRRIILAAYMMKQSDDYFACGKRRT